MVGRWKLKLEEGAKLQRKRADSMEAAVFSGDAIAISVKGAAQPRWHSSRRASSRLQCLLRVERRRSAKRVWERVVDKGIVLQPLIFLSSFERHRFEYRLSLRACNDASVLMLPPSLTVSRVNASRGVVHPHVGAFHVVPLQEPRLDTFAHAKQAASDRYSGTPHYGLIVVVMMMMISAIVRVYSRQPSTTRMHRTGPQKLNKHIRLPDKCRDYLRQTSKAEKEAAPNAERELLAAELPDFNDEAGWRQFFDAEIYGRGHARGSSDTPRETTRAVIGRCSNNSDEGTRLRRPLATHPTLRSASSSVTGAQDQPSSPKADDFGEFWQT